MHFIQIISAYGEEKFACLIYSIMLNTMDDGVSTLSDKIVGQSSNHIVIRHKVFFMGYLILAFRQYISSASHRRGKLSNK